MQEENIIAPGFAIIICIIIFACFIYRSFFSIDWICTDWYKKWTDIKTLLKEKNITDEKDIEVCYSTYNWYIEDYEKEKREKEIYNTEMEIIKNERIERVNSYYYK